jgi:hypothetical protein
LVAEPSIAGVTASGEDVLFEDQTALAPGATPGKSNVYLKNPVGGPPILAGVMNDGEAPERGAFAGPYDWFAGGTTEAGGAAAGYYTNESHVLSSSASRVFFTAAGSGDLYLRLNPTQPQSAVDGGGECTQLASGKACTVSISDERTAAFIGATEVGDEALFLSSASLTSDANTGPAEAGRDLYLYNVGTGDITDLTPKEGGNGAEVKGVLGYGEEAGGIPYVYFVANGVLAEGATAEGATPGTCTAEFEERLSGQCNLYVRHGGAIDFIARLAPGTEAEVKNWAPTSHGTGEDIQRSARVSKSGSVLLFRSRLKLTKYESGGVPEMYRYTAGTEEIICVSCNPTGAPATGAASVSNLPTPLARPTSTASVTTRNLSANGNRVFFDTPDKLVSSDGNGVNDVYEWEAMGEGSCASEAQDGGCLYLISTGTSPRPSYFVDASESGNDVFVLTAQPLVAQDRDELVDVYDARVHGGIPAQNRAEPTPCTEEAQCSQATSPPQKSAPAATAGFSGPANPKPLSCKKGFRRVTKGGKTKCEKVKPKAKKKTNKKHKKKSHKQQPQKKRSHHGHGRSKRDNGGSK